MFIRVRDSHSKSVGKAISWRIVGSIDTFVISLLVTGNYVAAGSVASLETVSKVILYYLHERAWSALPFCRTGLNGFAPTADDATVALVPPPHGIDRADAIATRHADTNAPLRSVTIGQPPNTPPVLQRGSISC